MKAYIAICKCGATVAATLDDPNHRDDVARHVFEWIKEGYVVERVDSDSVKKLFEPCRCPKQSFLFEMDDGSIGEMDIR